MNAITIRKFSNDIHWKPSAPLSAVASVCHALNRVCHDELLKVSVSLGNVGKLLRV